MFCDAVNKKENIGKNKAIHLELGGIANERSLCGVSSGGGYSEFCLGSIEMLLCGGS